jgi:predicted DNA-binding protein
MSKYTAFRCPEDLLELAKIKARKDRRSLSNYIITLIEKDVKDVSPEDLNRSPNAKKPAAKELQPVR